jgi:hypothetical protein
VPGALAFDPFLFISLAAGSLTIFYLCSKRTMWHLSVSAFSLGLALTVVAAPTPAQPKILRRLTPGANVISLSRTNSITDLATGQFNETFCMAHMTYL